MWDEFVKRITKAEPLPQTASSPPRIGTKNRLSSTVVVGLGNDVLTDDGVGLYVARYLRQLLDPDRYTIFELSVGGMELVEHLLGYKRAVVIDACRTGRHAAGTLTHHGPQDFSATLRLASYHTMNFATALELAHLLGAALPEQIDVFAIEVEDVETISEDCTPKLAARLPALADEIAQILKGQEEPRERVTTPDSRDGRG